MTRMRKRSCKQGSQPICREKEQFLQEGGYFSQLQAKIETPVIVWMADKSCKLVGLGRYAIAFPESSMSVSPFPFVSSSEKVLFYVFSHKFSAFC